MREIKYRAWGNTTKTMIDWDTIRPNLSLTFENAKRDAIILMQFTGLKDKNGKEIYEGDIIKQKDATYPVMAIEYDSEIGGWNYSYRNGEYAVSPDRAWEVIGNIYENPELLK